MSEHRIRQNNIIYIIPDDNLFEKWMNNEAFIDEYGRLINRKPHRVLRELRHYVEKPPVSQRPYNPPAAPTNNHPVKDYLKESIRDATADVAKDAIDYAVDKFFYEVLPNVWREHIVPFFRQDNKSHSSRSLKIDSVREPLKATEVIASKQKSNNTLSKEEADLEKRKLLYHWIEMLNSLKKLHDAGEIDIDSTLAQLTNPDMLNKINGLLSENPNLLETNKYISLNELLGRSLYKNEQLIPIEASEITTIAKSYGYDTDIN